MDSNLFERLLHVLLKTPVLKLDNKDEQLEQFENEYCFDENLQPMFTKEILLNIISDVEKMSSTKSQMTSMSIYLYLTSRMKYI